ncbi:hypothetical protein I550_5159 [Mycobacterium intracellulare 1956]|uniref:Uncharacterized protein n=1 Tax=Mycobacterium intracellulare 1956 TaxID=1299331 RepID=X8CDL3_MYCIT|nr:hypothetical protein I550_5159 [Mycobacterium intracellulare 1956]
MANCPPPSDKSGACAPRRRCRWEAGTTHIAPARDRCGGWGNRCIEKAGT